MFSSPHDGRRRPEPAIRALTDQSYFHSLLLIRSLIHNPSTHHGHLRNNIGDLCFLNRQRIGAQDSKVGELASL